MGPCGKLVGRETKKNINQQRRGRVWFRWLVQGQLLPGSGEELAPGQQWLVLASAQPLAQPLVILFVLHNLSNLTFLTFKPGMRAVSAS